jgi:uncharacterized protein
VKPPRHQIPADMFASLAAGGGGPAAVRHLAAVEYSKHLLLLHGVLDVSPRFGDAQHQIARRAYDLLASIQLRAPDAVDAVVRHPSVGAWAGRTVLAAEAARPGTGRVQPSAEPGAQPAGLAALAAAAAIRARYPCAIEVPVVAGLATFPSLGQAVIPARAGRGSTAILRSETGGAWLQAGERYVLIPDDPQVDGPGWQGLRSLVADSRGHVIRLLIDDLDPFRLPSPSLASRLAEAEVTIWQTHLGDAWDVLARYHRGAAAEILGAISVLTPLAAPSQGLVSATSRETFGSAGVSSPADAIAFALALAHEVQHAKLCALLDVVQLTHSDGGTRYYAPWRDDPRPASALLQGAYAYLGVTGFWRRQRHLAKGDDVIRAHAEFARWRSAVSAVLQTLVESGSLTPAGEVFAGGMARVVRRWCQVPVPADAMLQASHNAEQHAQRWAVHER